MKKYIGILLLFIVFQTNQAQERGEDQLGAWYMYSGTHILTEKWSINSAIQLWDYEPVDNFNLFLVLTGVDYKFTNKLTSTIGYGYATIDGSFEHIPEESMTREHRFYEQLSFKNTIWKLNIDHRFRIEHRFLNDAKTTNLRHRNRYRLQLTLPITDTFFVNVYEELFWYFEKDFMNQNRVYAALGICMTPNSKLQLGYLKHHMRHTSYDRLQLSVAIKTDFRKVKNNSLADNNLMYNFDDQELLSD